MLLLRRHDVFAITTKLLTVKVETQNLLKTLETYLLPLFVSFVKKHYLFCYKHCYLVLYKSNHISTHGNDAREGQSDGRQRAGDDGNCASRLSAIFYPRRNLPVIWQVQPIAWSLLCPLCHPENGANKLSSTTEVTKTENNTSIEWYGT